MEITEALGQIIKNMTAVADNLGFSVVVPSGIEKGAVPVSVANGKYTVAFTGDKGSFKIEVVDGKIYLKCAASQYKDAVEEDYAQASTSLFENEDVTDRDLRSMANEFNETVEKTYSKASKKQQSKVLNPVSKTAAKNGNAYFDSNTLGSRIAHMFPELKDAYKANVDRYGEFLPEDFFINHGNKFIEATIRQNDPTKMRKLFNCLNEIYNDGTNEVQSVIVVTILGSMAQEEQLLANCVDYMEDMTLSVVEVCKQLRRSKSLRAKLENPPKYKPKKQKRQRFMPGQLGQ
ncbi:MAG: hypothetical protein IJZ88_00200 [Clostridia bacterium]|nr:hypothetical protein [Clostridia bacterium]